MNTKKLMAIACTAAFCGGALASGEAKPATEAEEESGWAWAPGEGVTFRENPVVAVEAGVAFDSRYMTYGVIDGKDPIVTPSAQITFFDWVYFGVESIFDVTRANGAHKTDRGDYGPRAGKWTTLDAIVGVAHDFELCESLGALSVDFNYIYEYFHRYTDSFGDKGMDDTQYLNLELSLGDLWVEPTLAIERDLMADDGTYVNFSIGHEFSLIDGQGEDADPVLAFRPSVGQGFGNTQRAAGYFAKNKYTDEPLSHGGLMDTTIMGELTWNICDGVSLSGYVAYSDYLFDSNMRDGAISHNAAYGHSCEHSWNFYGGVALGLSF